MYKRLRNRINGEVKSTKASYYASTFIQSNGDSRKTWQLINELTPRQKNNALYADDTHITYASADLHSMQSSLNRDLSNIHKWLLCNKLTLNSTKTEFI
ncbi:unnamed protein product, partial [Porites lobata]